MEKQYSIFREIDENGKREFPRLHMNPKTGVIDCWVFGNCLSAAIPTEETLKKYGYGDNVKICPMHTLYGPKQLELIKENDELRCPGKYGCRLKCIKTSEDGPLFEVITVPKSLCDLWSEFPTIKLEKDKCTGSIVKKVLCSEEKIRLAEKD